MNVNAHVKFVIKELEKIQGSGGESAVARDEAAPVQGQGQEEPASSAERNELGRVANAVSA